MSAYVGSCRSVTPRDQMSVDRASLNIRRPEDVPPNNTEEAQQHYRNTNPRPETETESENRARNLSLDLAVLRHACGLRVVVSAWWNPSGKFDRYPRPPVQYPTVSRVIRGRDRDLPTDSESVCRWALEALARYRAHPLPHGRTSHNPYACWIVTTCRKRFVPVTLTAVVPARPVVDSRSEPGSAAGPEQTKTFVLRMPANGLSWEGRAPLDLVRYCLRRAPGWFEGVTEADCEWLETQALWAKNEAWGGEWEPVVESLSMSPEPVDPDTAAHGGDVVPLVTPDWLALLQRRYRDAWSQPGFLHDLYGPADVPLSIGGSVSEPKKRAAPSPNPSEDTTQPGSEAVSNPVPSETPPPAPKRVRVDGP